MRFLHEDDPRRQLWERCESPIEQIVCTMLFADLGASVVPAGHTLSEFVTDYPRAFLFAQHRIAGYRLDFLVVVADREGHRAFAIECDGHDYHSSVDQQIHDLDRDDDLRRAGVDEVCRFQWATNREAHRLGCRSNCRRAARLWDRADAAG